ncbi:sulfurtransferase-like selenium metabolism protein YedF [Eggerthella sp. YY7918]|uniref:sulfurtransferase-like selenium metabolism protein YedF n=1 Tax=Eggerthella sp. (strain YY7918) TaxID=502558 RepID=UPI0002171793|nr:sulfurtransferase-like selenium metabolism protein YedF [Eggerthella sp. YY7918]BAK44515.1 hypothetical protein EGYY_13630 [Eggerthella sp. YY7918]
MEQIDARGQACPLPVVRAKKALSAMEAGKLEVLVDNETAVHNLEALARTLKYEAGSEQRGDEFAVIITKGAKENDDVSVATGDQPATSSDENAAQGAQVVVISSEFMGSGDDVLGRTLMKAFIFALTQQDELPAAVLLYNGGVTWACEGSEALDDLRALIDEGVEVLSCGTCLQHYGLTDQLAVGEATNMYVIVERQMAASVVVRP